MFGNVVVVVVFCDLFDGLLNVSCGDGSGVRIVEEMDVLSRRR